MVGWGGAGPLGGALVTSAPSGRGTAAGAAESPKVAERGPRDGPAAATRWLVPPSGGGADAAASARQSFQRGAHRREFNQLFFVC